MHRYQEAAPPPRGPEVIAYSYRAPGHTSPRFAVATGDNPADVIVKGLTTYGQAARRAVKEAQKRGCQAWFAVGEKRFPL